MAKKDDKKEIIASKISGNKKLLATLAAASVLVLTVFIAGILYFGLSLYFTKKQSKSFSACAQEALTREEECKDERCSGLVLTPKTNCYDECESETNEDIGECYKRLYEE